MSTRNVFEQQATMVRYLMVKPAGELAMDDFQRQGRHPRESIKEGGSNYHSHSSACALNKSKQRFRELMTMPRPIGAKKYLTQAINQQNCNQLFSSRCWLLCFTVRVSRVPRLDTLKISAAPDSSACLSSKPLYYLKRTVHNHAIRYY